MRLFGGVLFMTWEVFCCCECWDCWCCICWDCWWTWGCPICWVCRVYWKNIFVFKSILYPTLAYILNYPILLFCYIFNTGSIPLMPNCTLNFYLILIPIIIKHIENRIIISYYKFYGTSKLCEEWVISQAQVLLVFLPPKVWLYQHKIYLKFNN